MALDDAISRFAERGREQRAERETKRERNAEAMPQAAAEVRKFREVFGKGTAGRLTENGHTVEWGTRLPEPDLPPILTVSQLVRGLADGSLQPTGRVVEKPRRPVFDDAIANDVAP
jgi:hypothetical protein